MEKKFALKKMYACDWTWEKIALKKRYAQNGTWGKKIDSSQGCAKWNFEKKFSRQTVMQNFSNSSKWRKAPDPSSSFPPIKVWAKNRWSLPPFYLKSYMYESMTSIALPRAETYDLMVSYAVRAQGDIISSFTFKRQLWYIIWLYHIKCNLKSAFTWWKLNSNKF